MKAVPKTPTLSHQMLLQESDRGCALVGQAAVEENLELLLRASLSSNSEVVTSSVAPLFAKNGPLASFWAKIQLANALGLLTHAVYSDLENIRKLRNQFAHQRDAVDFNDPSVVLRIKQLSTTEQYADRMKNKRYSIKPHRSGKTPSEAHLQEKGFIKFHRACFGFCVENTLLYLDAAIKVVRKGGPQAGKTWARLWAEKFS